MPAPTSHAAFSALPHRPTTLQPRRLKSWHAMLLGGLGLGAGVRLGFEFGLALGLGLGLGSGG